MSSEVLPPLGRLTGVAGARAGHQPGCPCHGWTREPGGRGLWDEDEDPCPDLQAQVEGAGDPGGLGTRRVSWVLGAHPGPQGSRQWGQVPSLRAWQSPRGWEEGVGPPGGLGTASCPLRAAAGPEGCPRQALVTWPGRAARGSGHVRPAGHPRSPPCAGRRWSYFRRLVKTRTVWPDGAMPPPTGPSLPGRPGPVCCGDSRPPSARQPAQLRAAPKGCSPRPHSRESPVLRTTGRGPPGCSSRRPGPSLLPPGTNARPQQIKEVIRAVTFFMLPRGPPAPPIPHPPHAPHPRRMQHTILLWASSQTTPPSAGVLREGPTAKVPEARTAMATASLGQGRSDQLQGCGGSGRVRR